LLAKVESVGCPKGETFGRVKTKGLRGGILQYVAQASPRVDTARAKKDRFRMETFMHSIRRKRGHAFLRSSRFLRRFRKSTEAAFTSGNRVELFRHGGDFLPAMLEEFSTATSHICLEFYIIRNDRIGDLFARSLAEAAGRGIAVHLIYDYLGCLETPASYFRELEKSGIRCIPFNRPTFRKGLGWFDRRNHRKYACIDGNRVFLGGLNIGNEYAGFGDSIDKWRDVGVRIEGPVAFEFQRLFRETWIEETGSPPPGLPAAIIPETVNGTADVMVVNGTPHHTRSFIRSSFRMAIAGASKSVRIITPYFVPGPLVVRSLLRAAMHGVRIQILLPAISDIPLVKIASRAYLSALLKGGIEIYERKGTVLHAKVMLIDGCWAATGSANLDFRSFHRNYEVNVIVDQPEFGMQVNRMFDEDLERSGRITLEEHESRGWFEKLLERLCDPIRRFL